MKITEDINDKMKDVMSKLVKSLGIKSVQSMHTGKGSLSYFIDDERESKKLQKKYRIWLEKSLKDFGVNPKHYDYRTNASAEEKLFQLGK